MNDQANESEVQLKQGQSEQVLAKQVPQEQPKRGFGIGAGLGLTVVVVVLAFVIYSGIRNRVSADAALKTTTEENATPTVSIVRPTPAAPAEEIVLPGNIQAFTDTPIYARTNGYLKSWYFDIGTHVKKGQLLAEIESPEVDKQLLAAKAELETAKANLELAKSTAERWQDLLRTNSVSKQETDEKISNFSVMKAAHDASASNVHRLEDLQSFEKVYAPFDGVITARNTDFGALIDAGANAPGRELFRLAAIYKLRVFVTVPQMYSRAARVGSTAILRLNEFPGKDFHGKLVRTSNAIDPASRTLLTEIDVDNPTGQILPGAYVTVHMKVPEQIKSVTVPSNTLLFRSEGLRIGVVKGDKVELVPVIVGRDYGRDIEILSGLQPDDSVIADPPDSLVSGTVVHAKEAASK